MATIYKCDRCNREFDNPLVKIGVPLLDYYLHISDEFSQKDLCEPCIRKLTEWLKPESIVKEK